MSTASPLLGGGGETTLWLKCGSKVILDWAFAPDANQNEFVNSPKYVYNAAGLPNEIGVWLRNISAGPKSFTLVGLCANAS